MLRKQRRQQQLRLNKLKKKQKPKQKEEKKKSERKRKLLLCIFNRGLSAIFHFMETFALLTYARIGFSLSVAELSNEFLMWDKENVAPSPVPLQQLPPQLPTMSL